MPPSPRICAAERSAAMDAVDDERFDLVVIGGGITGAGIARDASLRGMTVALIEARDFAAGTSSRSSKLIHGGLRYLAQGEVALVRETALERKAVRALAPHLAEPCWMVVPARSRAGLLKFRAGIGTYEKLGAVEAADRHRGWSGEELRSQEPCLRRDRFPHACAYREYLTDDARLVIANLRSAVAGGAMLLSHAPVTGIFFEGERASGVRARCSESGRELRVRARCIVNAAGPWVEGVAALEGSDAAPQLHLSKGVHVVLPAERLPVRNLVILGAQDKRSIFAIPKGDAVYLGTTDTSYGGRADLWPPIEREDVEYLLEPIPRYFDVAPMSPDECIGAWSGLRPLVAQAGKAPTEISRRDEVLVGPRGLVSIAGGKLTGYRRMAEQVMERVADVLGERIPAAPAEAPPLEGGDFDGDLSKLAAEISRSGSIDRSAADRLVRLYGADTHAVAALGSEPLVEGHPLLRGEVLWATDVEGARNLEDVVYRRTRAALYEPRTAAAMLEASAEILAGRLGWSDAQRLAQCEHTRGLLARDLAFVQSGVKGER